MQTNQDYYRTVGLRSTILWWVVVFFVFIFILRLFYVQVVRNSYYVEEAKASQVTKLTIFPERGNIYAVDNLGEEIVPFVLNETVYTVFADPYEVKNALEVRNVVNEIAAGEIVETGFDLLDDKKLRYAVLARQVSRPQAEMIAKKELAGVGLQKGSRRVYPEGILASQLLGFVDNEGIGKYGLEGYMDKELGGVPGRLETVTDVRRIPLTIGDDNVSQPALDGSDVVLSIDRSVQFKAERLLREGLERSKATKGSILVMNPSNGRILAMANYPTYDPAKYTEVDDYAVFQNKTVAYPYENGSVMKTLTMGAGLDSGAVTVNSTFADGTGCYKMEEWPKAICNVEDDPKKAAATMLDVLRYSLNTGVIYVLRQMGGGTINDQARNTLYSYFHDKYRYGQLTGVEQDGELAGTIIKPTDQEGSSIRYANMTFGQGMDNTMIQTASAFSMMINGGTYYKPTLVRGTYQQGQVIEKMPEVVASSVIRADISEQIRDLIWQGRKTGFFGKNDPEGFKVGGKTGTSQVIDPKTGRYSDDNSIGTYLGFGGSNSPEYVIMVRVDDAKVPGYAGTSAAGPIFNDMSNWLLRYLNVLPSAG
ncbi:penicillin-binding protein 2 [Candidatus Saccharibacteria bacterium]|nr:penicillin-binding protein 2 [Candidatus Saccharibacteria bacterium]